MGIEIRPMRMADLSAVVSVWNSCCVHDRLSGERFKHVVVEDPNYMEEGALVAVDADGVAALACCIVRADVTGRDGMGRPAEGGDAYLKAFCVRDGTDTDIWAMLMDRVETFVRTQGKERLRVVEYTGRQYAIDPSI